MTRKYSDEELLKLDPELEAIFNQQGWPKIRMPTREIVPRARQAFDAGFQKYNASPFAKQVLGTAFDKPTWDEADHDVSVREARTITVRIYTPNHVPSDGLPVVQNHHGGGWFMGSLSTSALFCRMICAKLGVIVIDVEFGLYPDVKFGVPVLDSYDAVKWTAENAARLGGNLQKGFVVSGESGGGTYAAAVAHLARDDGLEPPITGCFLMCPVLSDDTLDERGNMTTLFNRETEYRSQVQNAAAPLMNRKMQDGIANFADFDFRSPLTSSFHFPSHAHLPPCYIAVCGLDPWSDGGFLYQKELEKVGGETKLDCYAGMPHCWWTSYPQISRTKEWLQKSLQGMQWLLGKGDQMVAPKL